MQRKATVNDFTKPVTEILKVAVQFQPVLGMIETKDGKLGSESEIGEETGREMEMFTKMFQVR